MIKEEGEKMKQDSRSDLVAVNGNTPTGVSEYIFTKKCRLGKFEKVFSFDSNFTFCPHILQDLLSHPYALLTLKVLLLTETDSKS